MDIKHYCKVIYGLFYIYIHLFILMIIEFYGIFANILNNMIKKGLQKHIINDKMVQIYEIMMKYQLKKKFMTLYIGNTIILYGLLLNIIRIFMTLENVFFIGFYGKRNMNEKMKHSVKNVKNHMQSTKENTIRIICVAKCIFYKF